ncbi:MAG TPA: ATP-binding protein [Myxococcota bacterium]|nr:ATP-binding protein [Myxococcota bacterium]
MSDGIPVPKSWPDSWPEWARRMGELYATGTTAMFVLHGATHDLVRIEEAGGARYGALAEFLAQQLFGRWDLVLHYDLGRGLRAFAGRDEARLRAMVEKASGRIGDLTSLGKDPGTVLAALDRFVQRNVMADETDRLGTAVVFDHASFFAPNVGPGQLSIASASQLVTLLNWASSPYVKRVNMAFVLCDEKLAQLSDRLATSPHVAALEVALPDEPAREQFARERLAGRDLQKVSDYDVGELARLTAGLSLVDLDTLLRTTLETGHRLDAELFRATKKRLLERLAEGLLEFVEPEFGLDLVVGHAAIKQRLADDAELLRRGALESVPMGYLICGPVGTGKTFLATCASGSFGVPMVTLKNFRSKYVGETEANLEHLLGVLRAMGPVVVVIDEADAALGDRDQEGDSGTSARVFGMIATQMGNTRYRGRILWMLLTCRPDLLPIDLKRQGRAEVHIPLFYPEEDAELTAMFLAMAKKLGTKLAAGDVPQVPAEKRGHLSGADIEGLVGRAWRRSLLAGSDRVTAEHLREALDQFLPSMEGLEKELQESAAVLECTDREFLPASQRKRIEAPGGRALLQQRLTELKRLVDG